MPLIDDFLKRKKKTAEKTAELRIVLSSAGKPSGQPSDLISQHPFTYNLKGYLINSTLLTCSKTANFLACTFMSSGYTSMEPCWSDDGTAVIYCKFRHLIIGEWNSNRQSVKYNKSFISFPVLPAKYTRQTHFTLGKDLKVLWSANYSKVSSFYRENT